MQGTILDYSIQKNSGLISGDDNNRYTFTGNDWRSQNPPNRGERVDFNANASGSAVDIYVIQSRVNQTYAPNTPAPIVGQKSKIAAGILALLFGAFGVHKFYLGRIGWGFIYLLFCWTFIPSIIAFIEGIIYLCTSNEDFAKKYG